MKESLRLCLGFGIVVPATDYHGQNQVIVRFRDMMWIRQNLPAVCFDQVIVRIHRMRNEMIV